MTDHPDTLASIAQRIERKAENITDRRWLVNEVRRLRAALAAHDQQDPRSQDDEDFIVATLADAGVPNSRALGRDIMDGLVNPGSDVSDTPAPPDMSRLCTSMLHEFEPGVDVDDPDRPSYDWCNVCGERQAPATPEGGQPDPDDELLDLLTDADYFAEGTTRGRTTPKLVADLASALRRKREVIHGCACPAPYDACTHDEPLLSVIRRLERELVDARSHGEEWPIERIAEYVHLADELAKDNERLERELAEARHQADAMADHAAQLMDERDDLRREMGM